MEKIMNFRGLSATTSPVLYSSLVVSQMERVKDNLPYYPLVHGETDPLSWVRRYLEQTSYIMGVFLSSGQRTNDSMMVTKVLSRQWSRVKILSLTYLVVPANTDSLGGKYHHNAQMVMLSRVRIPMAYPWMLVVHPTMPIHAQKSMLVWKNSNQSLLLTQIVMLR